LNNSIDIDDLKAKARGNWENILPNFGIDSKFLNRKHQSCPCCGDGGKGNESDRFRYDDKNGDGDYFCNKCGAGDGISLIQKSTGKDFQDVLKELSEYLNIAPLEPYTPPKKEKSEWEPIFPVPQEALELLNKNRVDIWNQTKKKNSMLYPKMVFHYRDTSGDCVGSVLRIQKQTGGKWTPQVIYAKNIKTDEIKWTYGSIPYPRPLFGSETLKKAKSVLVVEGEKTALAARRIIGTEERAVVTWCGGTKVAERNRWQDLAGKMVIIWPDSDLHVYDSRHGKKAGELIPWDKQEGFSAALTIAESLNSHKITCKIVDPRKLPREDGWDLADAEDQGWDSEEVLKYLKSNLLNPPQKEVKKQEEKPKKTEKKKKEKTDDIPYLNDDEIKNALENYVRFLGYDYDYNYYYSFERNQVISMSASAHTRQGLYLLAPEAIWSACFPLLDSKSRAKFDIDIAIDQMNRRSVLAGHYDPTRVRKSGAWWDNDKVVLHLGNRLLCNNKEHKLEDFKSGFIYESRPKLEFNHGEVLSRTEINLINEISDGIKWKYPSLGAFALGWAVLAPFCGLISWRPHIWIMGPSGSGKSTILRDFLVPLLGGIQIGPSGIYSEPGVRQAIDGQVLPVIMEEAEGKNRWTFDKIQSLLNLARVCSDDSAPMSLLGNQKGSGRRGNLKSMFAFVSIQDSIKDDSDRNRTAILELKTWAPGESSESKSKQWKVLRSKIEQINKETGYRLINRTISIIDVLMKTIDIFKESVSQSLESQRLGDTYGTLVAGWWCLKYDRVPTEAEINAVTKMITDDIKAEEEQSGSDHESIDCLFTMMQSQIRCEINGRPRTATLGELVSDEIDNKSNQQNVFEEFNNINNPDGESNDTRKVLSRHGIRVDDDHCLLIANKCVSMEKLLVGTQYAVNWHRYLLRIPGAEKQGVVNFGGLFRQRCTKIPANLIREAKK